jgi:mitochondrial distribution and morphology protein 34
MEDLPAIIHRLSLRLWVPEYRAKEDAELARQAAMAEETPVDPLSTPPQDPVDSVGNVPDMTFLSLDSSSSDGTSLFSQKNLLRLAALNDSHRTLSLFTPSIKDTVFRAWAGTRDSDSGSGGHGMNTPQTPGFASSQMSNGGSSTTYTFSDTASNGQLPSRPSLVSLNSATTGLGLGSGRTRSHNNKSKKKNRVINLRRRKPDGGSETASDDGGSCTASVTDSTDSASVSASVEASIPDAIIEEREEELVTPPLSPHGRVRFRRSQDSIDLGDSPMRLKPLTPSRKTSSPQKATVSDRTPRASMVAESSQTQSASSSAEAPARVLSYQNEKDPQQQTYRPATGRPQPYQFPSYHYAQESQSPTLYEPVSGGILEKAWMMRMAGEFARRAADVSASANEKQPSLDLGESSAWVRGMRGETPPPAYGSEAF